MIRVAICDDDKHMQESLSKYLLDYSIQCDREIDHAEFDTCEELMDEYLKGNSFDVILLDIEFKNNEEKQMNGIELGKRLRGLYANDNTAIVYNVPLVKTQMKKIIVTAKTLYSHPKNVSKIYAALHTDLAW